MRSLTCALLCTALVMGCAPLGDASSPSDDEMPCRTDDDCALADVSRGPREQLCSSRMLGDSAVGKNAAACMPMPNMTPRIREPTFVCFRGTCSPVSAR